jgi:hypothetical protein
VVLRSWHPLPEGERRRFSSALALTGHEAEAHEMLARYLALRDVHSKTVAQLGAQVLIADNPAWVEFTERVFASLRKAGMPEK